MYVKVEGNLDKALKIFNKKVKRAGIMQEIYKRRHYEKPSVKKRKKHEEAVRRQRREEKNRKN